MAIQCRVPPTPARLASSPARQPACRRHPLAVVIRVASLLRADGCFVLLQPVQGHPTGAVPLPVTMSRGMNSGAMTHPMPQPTRTVAVQPAPAMPMRPVAVQRQVAPAPPVAGGQSMLVTIPVGHRPGVPLQLQAPNGAVVSVAVPAGMVPGQQFQVQMPGLSQRRQPVPVAPVPVAPVPVPMASNVEVVGRSSEPQQGLTAADLQRQGQAALKQGQVAANKVAGFASSGMAKLKQRMK